MNFWKTMDGIITATLTSADPSESLQMLNRAGVRLWQVEWVEDLTVRFQCARRDRKTLERISRKRGDRLCILGETGFRQGCRRLLKRPVLVTGILLLFLLTALLPTRVFFFRVEGNQTVPSRQILEAAAACGIRFGVSRRQVRSEKMKNELLGAMPGLKWAGINTLGCTATISVRERAAEEGKQADVSNLGSIAAVRDAYVTDITVTRGTAHCTPGQVVSAGEILISGYTDLGLLVQVTQAQGEVFGETIHDFQAVTPAQALFRTEEEEIERRCSLIFGKKRFNFGKGSGISPVTCGRIYKEYYVTLPGGFQLPVGLGLETLTTWKTAPEEMEPEENAMLDFARKQVLARTVAGSILAEDLAFVREGQRLVLGGRFSCREMIGRVTTEEIGEANGKTD